VFRLGMTPSGNWYSDKRTFRWLCVWEIIPEGAGTSCLDRLDANTVGSDPA
jgi:hypothetical protein